MVQDASCWTSRRPLLDHHPIWQAIKDFSNSNSVIKFKRFLNITKTTRDPKKVMSVLGYYFLEMYPESPLTSFTEQISKFMDSSESFSQSSMNSIDSSANLSQESNFELQVIPVVSQIEKFGF